MVRQCARVQSTGREDGLAGKERHWSDDNHCRPELRFGEGSTADTFNADELEQAKGRQNPGSIRGHDSPPKKEIRFWLGRFLAIEFFA